MSEAGVGAGAKELISREGETTLWGRNYLLLEKDGALHLNKFESPSPKDALCQVWMKIGSVVLEKKFCQFRYFLIISPWKRAGSFI